MRGERGAILLAQLPLEIFIEVIVEEAVEFIVEEGVAHALNHLLPCNELKTTFQCQQCCDDTFGPLGNYPTIRHCYIECSELPAG